MKYEHEVLKLAVQGESINHNKSWDDYICGSIRDFSEAETRDGFVSCVQDYLNDIPRLIQNYKDDHPIEELRGAGDLEEMENYAARAAKCDRELLRKLAAEKFDELHDND